MKVLYLTLKSKWYDMIEAGIKKEEYRELKHFWGTRLLYKIPVPHGGYWNAWNDIANEDYEFKGWASFCSPDLIFEKFTHVHFARGGHFHPSLPQMRFELTGIEVREGKPEWGAEYGKKYFVIMIGEQCPIELQGVQGSDTTEA
jgi:hypothetical protein